VLTKKIGTGVVSTGIKRDMCSGEAVEEITSSMAALNRRASEVMLEVGASTATDITGFGLIGHMLEVLRASGCRARLSAGKVPFFEEALRLAAKGVIPGGTRDNFNIFSKYVEWEEGVSEPRAILMNDAQTSGGLLIFAAGERKDALVSALEKEGIPAAHIGEVEGAEEKDEKLVHVSP
jgi:selenide,water dikinase